MNHCHILFPLLLALASAPSSADAFKCKDAAGRITISSAPCDDSAKVIATHRSESIPTQQQQNATNDLQRQKQYLNNVERERQPTTNQLVSNVNPHQGTGDAYDPDTRDRIHACLMKITATTGLYSTDIAQRKVNCYRGTRTLADECEGRITATTGLTTPQENNYKAQCRSISGS